MPRARMRWFKVSTAILYSSMNYELLLEEQAAFIKTLALCAELGGTGVIADGEGQPMPHDFIASRIHVPVEIFESMLEKCQRTHRISENSNGIVISKWKEYQSEYQRQKPYRHRKTGISSEGRELSKNAEYLQELGREMMQYRQNHHGQNPDKATEEEIRNKVMGKVYSDGD